MRKIISFQSLLYFFLFISFFLLYFILSISVGNKENFKIKTDNFMQYPDEVKKKANAKLLIPFFILLIIVFGLAFSKL